MRGLRTRLNRLDGGGKREFVPVFTKPNEPADEALARHFGEAGVPANVEPIVFVTTYEERPGDMA